MDHGIGNADDDVVLHPRDPQDPRPRRPPARARPRGSPRGLGPAPLSEGAEPARRPSDRDVHGPPSEGLRLRGCEAPGCCPRGRTDGPSPRGRRRSPAGPVNPPRGSDGRRSIGDRPSGIASLTEHDGLDGLHRPALQNPAAVDDDFSTHSGEVCDGQVAPLGPSVVHETHMDMSESARGGTVQSKPLHPHRGHGPRAEGAERRARERGRGRSGARLGLRESDSLLPTETPLWTAPLPCRVDVHGLRPPPAPLVRGPHPGPAPRGGPRRGRVPAGGAP